MHQKWEFNYITADHLPELVVAMCAAGSDGWEFAANMAQEKLEGFAVLMKRRYPPTVTFNLAND